MAISGHANVLAWQRGMDLAVAAYRLGCQLRLNRYGALASQLERAAVSIRSNIAEGKGRSGSAELAHFLSIAMGSLREVQTLVELCDRLGASKRETLIELRKLADEVGKLLFGLQKKVRADPRESQNAVPRADAESR